MRKSMWTEKSPVKGKKKVHRFQCLESCRSAYCYMQNMVGVEEPQRTKRSHHPHDVCLPINSVPSKTHISKLCQEIVK